MASLVWLGAVLAVLASMAGTTGKQLFRFAELQRQKGTPRSLLSSRMAMAFGLALNVALGPLLDMSSYAFAPQGIIAPLSGLDVVWNTLSAPCTLGESLNATLVFGCFLIASGATATSFFGSHDDKEFSPEMLKDVFLRWQVLAYLVALMLWLAFNITVLMPRSAAPKGQQFLTGDKIRGLSLGMTAGSIAGNMFCVKAFVELVQASIQHGKAEYWADWLPYVLLVGAVFFATSNLYFLTKAMREYEALFMGAVFEGSIITAACISGAIVFDELKGLEIWQALLYWLSLVLIVAGIAVVCRGCTQQASEAKVFTSPEEAKKEDEEDPKAQGKPADKEVTSEQALGTVGSELPRAHSISSHSLQSQPGITRLDSPFGAGVIARELALHHHELAPHPTFSGRFHT
mmetsp:Transcript_14404/g.36857  ORF Transcript_14404/g.36857 Transcript_14404/m.36857 type:complete len:403 (-) Transcript_14404:86-1294(-)